MKSKQSKEDMIKSEAEEVLSLIRGAWQLGRSAITGRYWLQSGGLGLGGPSKNVAENVVVYLLERGLITKDDKPEGYREDYSLA